MAIPDYQTLLRPVLESSAEGEAVISDVIDDLSVRFKLSDDERAERLPSGRQTKMSNRVHWAKSFLKQAGLVSSTGWGKFKATARGLDALSDPDVNIDRNYLERFAEF